mgnify:CR=1 FL=1
MPYDFGGTPNLEDCYDPTSLHYVKNNLFPIQEDITKEMNAFLEELQRGCFVNHQGEEVFYSAHGDLLFAPASCISRNHKPAPGAPLNAFQRAENAAINTARISIEHSYGMIQNKYKILLHLQM